MKPNHMTNQERSAKISSLWCFELFEYVDYVREYPMIFTHYNNYEVK